MRSWRLPSRVHTPATKPKSVALAKRIASSSSRNGMAASTGPNEGIADEMLRRNSNGGRIHLVKSFCRSELVCQGILVGTWRIRDAVARRPKVDLEMQRNNAAIIDRQLSCALQQSLALGIVDFLQRIIQQ